MEGVVAVVAVVVVVVPVVGDVDVAVADVGVVAPTKLLGTQHTSPPVSHVAALLSCTKSLGHDV